MAKEPESANPELFIGEWVRSVDERFRLSLPQEWADQLVDVKGECVLAKERPGCVSVWNPRDWTDWLNEGVGLVAGKIRSGRVAGRMSDVQMLGRLLSTRHKTVPIAGRGRIAIPDSFRTFLEVEPGGELMVVGAAVCVEIWNPARWSTHIGEHMSEFRQLFDQLAN